MKAIHRQNASLIAFAGLVAACAGTDVKVPDTLQPSANEVIAMVVPARGVQVYKCRAAKDGGHEWGFVAPDAELFDTNGKLIGRHGAGPYWESLDGSRVNASLKSKADAPDKRDIPWLLLAARNTGPAGAFSTVTSIQRVNTVGGSAPANGCDAATVGQEARVHYTADYRFFTQR
jgi:hypothetical protein